MMYCLDWTKSSVLVYFDAIRMCRIGTTGSFGMALSGWEQYQGEFVV